MQQLLAQLASNSTTGAASASGASIHHLPQSVMDSGQRSDSGQAQEDAAKISKKAKKAERRWQLPSITVTVTVIQAIPATAPLLRQCATRRSQRNGLATTAAKAVGDPKATAVPRPQCGSAGGSWWRLEPSILLFWRMIVTGMSARSRSGAVYTSVRTEVPALSRRSCQCRMTLRKS
eukprot:6179766-Pleurochrysis_carterae.AAC.3